MNRPLQVYKELNQKNQRLVNKVIIAMHSGQVSDTIWLNINKLLNRARRSKTHANPRKYTNGNWSMLVPKMTTRNVIFTAYQTILDLLIWPGNPHLYHSVHTSVSISNTYFSRYRKTVSIAQILDEYLQQVNASWIESIWIWKNFRSLIVTYSITTWIGWSQVCMQCISLQGLMT